VPWYEQTRWTEALVCDLCGGVAGGWRIIVSLNGDFAPPYGATFDLPPSGLEGGLCPALSAMTDLYRCNLGDGPVPPSPAVPGVQRHSRRGHDGLAGTHISDSSQGRGLLLVCPGQNVSLLLLRGATPRHLPLGRGCSPADPAPHGRPHSQLPIPTHPLAYTHTWHTSASNRELCGGVRCR
jgi:hypothetical protein